MYRYVPFDEIDKNKWNGTVHYASNGNVYGYYWYLKAAVREWDAIVEDDYQSVMPILTEPLLQEMYDLIPQLGPYSVNVLHSGRVNQMIDMAMERNKTSIYPLNVGLNRSILKSRKTEEILFSTFNLGKTYEDLSGKYDKSIYHSIHGTTKDHLSFISGVKPEIIVDATSYPAVKKNALMRIMYNAMQQGIGFSNGIKDKQTQKFLALSFFIATHNKLHEICAIPHPDQDARRLLMDLVIRNGAGKPMSIQTYYDALLLEGMGFIKESSMRLDTSNFISRIKKAVKLPY